MEKYEILKSASKKEVTIDEKTGRVRVQTINTLPTKTQQQFKDRCDLNKIMKQAKRTGELPAQRAARGYYMDHTVLPADYQRALDLVIDGEVAFNGLPSEVRARFENDPKKLLTFLSDKKNLDEAIKLGLAQAPVEQPPVEKAKSATRQKAKNDEVVSNDEES